MKPCIVIVTTDQERNAQLKKLGVSFLEIRIDLFKKNDLSYALQVVKHRMLLRVPLILTVRNQKKEGALKEMSDLKKWALLESLLPHCQWVDIELSSPLCAKTVALARRLKKKVVISVHDFVRMPEHLNHLLTKSLSARADMVKIAVRTASMRDLSRLIEFSVQHKHLPLVTMGIGSVGAFSRLILPLFGSRWVYTFVNKPTAVGQLDFEQYVACYRAIQPILMFNSSSS